MTDRLDRLENMVKEAFYLQNAMNSKVDENWARNGWNWNLAAGQEFAEYNDHIGYKWWKKQEPDMEQAFIELVDIFHFYLSAVIEYEGYVDIQESMTAAYIADLLVKEATVPETMSLQECLIHWSTKCIKSCMDDQMYEFKLVYLAFMVNAMGYTAEDLLKTYIAKNTLNIFRQDNGYKDGSYIKIWNGEEDNVVMARLIENSPELIENTSSLMVEMNKLYKAL